MLERSLGNKKKYVTVCCDTVLQSGDILYTVCHLCFSDSMITVCPSDSVHGTSSSLDDLTNMNDCNCHQWASSIQAKSITRTDIATDEYTVPDTLDYMILGPSSLRSVATEGALNLRRLSKQRGVVQLVPLAAKYCS